MGASVLWISVIAWGLVVGAKLLDLRVLVGAWGGAPPGFIALKLASGFAIATILAFVVYFVSKL